MRRASGLLVVLLVGYVAQRAAPGAPAASGSITLAIGFALVAAVIAGSLIEHMALPRVTGYLLLGLLCGPYVLNLITQPMARELRVLNGVAVSLIAFVAGLELNIVHLRPRLRAIAVIGGITIAVVWTAAFAGLSLAWPLLPVPAGASPMLRAAIAAVMATLVASFSPTITIAVLAELRARGPFSELTVALVVAADLVLIVLFALCLQFTRWAGGAGGHDTGLLVTLSWEIAGSLAFGAIAGAFFALYLAHVAREVTLVLLVLCALLSELSPAAHLDAVLAALAAGLVVENIAPPRGDALKQAVERSSLPVLIVFFAAAGASLDLRALAATGPVALAIAAGRAGAIWAGATAGAHAAGVPQPVAGLIWMGLVSQAGVTLGLATIVAREFPDWGGSVQALVLALTGLHVLAGPVLLRAAVARAGELGTAEANRRVPDASPATGDT
jgi:Kef-type K+ transport system membrane component KefB